MNQIAVENFAQDVGLGHVHKVPAGYTVEQIAEHFFESLDGLTAWIKAPEGYVTEWIEVNRATWKLMRPKISGVLKFGYRVQKSALKTVFAIVAAITVAVVAPWLAGTALFSTFGAFAGTAAALVVSAGVSLLSNALFPASTDSGIVSASGGSNENSTYSNVESDNNVIAKAAYLPVVAGIRRISLPEIAQPRMFLSADTGLQTVHRIFGLHGEHEITDIQVDGVSIDDNEAFEYEVINGAEDDPTETFIDKVSWSDSVRSELSNFSLTNLLLVDQDEPSNSLPLWERFTSRYDSQMEAINIRLQLSGMIQSSSAGTSVRVPVRVRFREADTDDDWTNLPEIHFVGNLSSTAIQELTIRWDNDFGTADTTGYISHQFFQNVPAATAGTLSQGTTGDQWQADSQFVDGSGLRDVQNITGGRNGVRIQLDPTVSPKAKYEIEIQRGYATSQSGLNTSTYVYSGAVHSFFDAYSTTSGWSVKTDQSDYLAQAQISFVSTVSDRQPCQRPNTALVAIKSRGQSIKNVTALCGAKVLDWDGSAWATKTTSSNPATHYYSMLSKFYDYHGVSLDLIDEDSILAFRQECIDKGYEVSTSVAGATTAETLSSIAVAGFAKPAVSIGVGVDYFRDRSNDRPVQTFSPRNATIELALNHGVKPMGIRAKFQNEENGYIDDEIEVNNPFYSSDRVYEVQEYPTITNPELVRKRAYFDLMQIHEQSRRTWLIETSLEGTICKPGDLVGVVTDLLDDLSFGARVSSVESGSIFEIDQDVPVQSTESIYDTDNIFSEANVFTTGEQSVIFISTPTGTHQSVITGLSGRTIRIADPLDTTNFKGAHVTIGPLTNFMNRCIVKQVNRLDEERSELVLVDEAPNIYSAMEAKFS